MSIVINVVPAAILLVAVASIATLVFTIAREARLGSVLSMILGTGGLMMSLAGKKSEQGAVAILILIMVCVIAALIGNYMKRKYPLPPEDTSNQKPV